MMNTEDVDHTDLQLHKNTVETEIQLLATHRGNFKKDFGIDVDCYVLNDERHTAVISKRGMARSLGMSDRGNSITNLVQSKSLSEIITSADGLREKLSNPLIFKDSLSADGKLNPIVHGYDVTILIDLCQAIKKANEEGKLAPNQKHIRNHCSSICKSWNQGLSLCFIWI